MARAFSFRGEHAGLVLVEEVVSGWNVTADGAVIYEAKGLNSARTYAESYVAGYECGYELGLAKSAAVKTDGFGKEKS